MLFMVVIMSGQVEGSDLVYRGGRNRLLQSDDSLGDFARLFEQSPAYKAYLRGPDHELEHANAAYLTLVNGYERLDRTRLQAVYSSGETAWHPSVPVEGERGTVNIDFTYQPIRKDGEVVGVLVLGTVTPEAAEAERADFLRKLSHSIRSPLNAVTGLAGLLLTSDPLTEEQREYTRALKLSADSVLTQVQDMLDEARLRAGLKLAAVTPALPGASDAPLVVPDLPVLLVEDYEPNVLLATTYLESFGFRVEVASNGKAAVDKATSRDYALALIDVQMPGMDGLEATANIRAHEFKTGTGRLPIIGVTAHSLAGDRERCLAAGMDDYLPKPFTAEELHDHVRAALARAA